MEQVDVLIVGSGPAGTSTALHLVKVDPAWAGRMVVIDKAIHPREKLCGGGITHMGQNTLAGLGLRIGVPYTPIRKAIVVFQDIEYAFYGNPVFVVVRRDQFDHWLVKEAEKAGVSVRQGVALKKIEVKDGYVEAVTGTGMIHARSVVAADGSKSLVRRKLKWDDESRVARLLEILTPEDGTSGEFRTGTAIFEFGRIVDGLQGYYWDFPSLVDGKPMMNRGVFDSRIRPERPKVDLVNNLRGALSERDLDLDDYKLKGHPIRWFDKNGRFAVPRVLLAGDSAGVDPLVGEGISFALSYGQVAAAAISSAFAAGDFAFSDYRDRILNNNVLKQLPVRVRLARLGYWIKSPTIHRLGWLAVKVLVRYTKWADPEYNPIVPADLVYES